MRLEGKVAIITGAGAGIGQTTAVLFAKEGASIVVDDIDKARGMETVEIIKGQNGKAIFVLADVRKAGDVKKIVDVAAGTYGKIDILVNNAGILYDVAASIVDTAEDEWDSILNTNLKGTFLCCKYSIPEMIKNKAGGSIVNIGSEAGLRGEKNLSAYCVSKSGVIELTKCIAIEYAANNIRANCVCPGTTYTPMVIEAIEKAPDPEKQRHEYERVRPANRLGRPEEIAAGVLYLASDESRYATGSILNIDGGSTAWFGW